ncbi:MAG: FAD-dependent oxidoreductase [Burkholderiales bacterium]|nr:FAD-dependent oxidoreductase [Burkholderiales bacterium]
MRIAIIGTGIAGNAAAYALSTSTGHDLTIYEQDSRPGGHSATVDVAYDGVTLAVDTGFIVYNEMNYPNLTALFAHLGVATQDSTMSFAVSARGGRFEWCGRTERVVDGLFAQRRNLLSPGYLSMLLEILRFNRLAIVDRRSGLLADLSLSEYLARRGYSRRFRDDYLIPMGAAIWSMSPAAMLAFPAASFVAFFENHHLLQWNRPVWRTVTGGSRSYVEKISEPFRDKVRLNSGVRSVQRSAFGVEITDESGHKDTFDQVIFATHSDQALACLADPSPQERDVLGAIGYRPNAVYLHRDERLMPRRKRAWAAWNVIQGADPDAELCVTYWMNALQAFDPSRPLFVTLNPPEPPAPHLTFGTFSYDHPQYDQRAIAAQRLIPEIQGQRRTWFAGAWTGFGFHEDGLSSGLAVAEALGGRVPWREASAPFAEAAE